MSTIVPEQTRRITEITSFNFDSEVEPGPIYYSTESDRVWFSRGGDQHAAMLIRFDVDREFTSVDVDLGRSSDTTVLDRAIAALTELRDQRREMGGPGYGQCMASGEWGRCGLREGHEIDCDHTFPTEEEWRAEQEVLHGRTFPKSA